MRTPGVCVECGTGLPGRRWKCDDCKRSDGRPRSPDKTTARARQVLRLRAEGQTFAVIAEQLGYANRGAAHKAYQRAMCETGTSGLSTSEKRELELHRIDLILQALVPAAARGDLGAVDRYDKLAKLRIRMEGLAVASGSHAAAGEGRNGDQAGVVVGPSALEAKREERARAEAERTARS